jgi:hypothetical protein
MGRQVQARPDDYSSPAVVAPKDFSRLIDLDSRLVTALLGLQVFLYFFWQATQFPAIPGSWWSGLFNRSGPVLLPIMFGVELVTLGAAIPLIWQRRAMIRQTPAALFLMAAVAGGCLTIPLAYLNHFDHTKIWKDVAFLLGYLTLPVVLVLGRRTARNFYFYYLAVSITSGGLMLIEALRRSAAIHESFGHFLLHTYRIYAGGHFQEVLLLSGALVVVLSNARAIRRIVWAPLVVAAVWVDIRFRVNLTRLYWISLAVAWPITMLWVLPRRFLRPALILVAMTGVLFLVAGFGAGILSNGSDLSSRFNGPQDVSVDFRIVESEVLFRAVRSRPLTGWGPGGTISPNVAAEPLRNNTSSFFDGYLGIPYKFGLIVFFAIVAGVVAAIWQVRSRLRSPLPALDMAVTAGAAAFLVGVLTTSAASDLLFANFSALPVGLMAGIATRLTAREPVAAGTSGAATLRRDSLVQA